MKIVHLIPQDSLGGAETAAREMACRPDLSCDFQLISLAGEPLATGQQRMTGLGYGNPLNPLAQLAAARTVRSLEPDVLICSLWKCVPAAILAKLLWPRAKLVAFFHSATRVHSIDRAMHWLLLRFADAVWTDSEATLDALGSAATGKASRVVSFVLDRSPASASERQPTPRFVSLARIHEDKGIDRAVDLIADLVARGVDARLDLWGPDQGFADSLQRQAEGLGIRDRVRFHGPFSRSDLPTISADGSFLVQLSRLEGMAMAVVEAMQLGLVPVVTPVGEMGRYCRDGENAIVVDVARLDAAAEQIAALLDEPARYSSMSKAARAIWSDCRLYADDVCAAAQELAGQA